MPEPSFSNILLVEPFFSGSHKQWAQSLKQYSNHNISLLTLPGRYWKWRMYGGAVELAHQFLKSNFEPDLILASDMLDLTTFLALTRHRTASIPALVYFHENQITYPWSPTDQDVELKRNNQYGFLNYTSALAANKLLFNSNFHKSSFLSSLPKFLEQFPDFQGLETIKGIEKKSEVLYLGLDLKRFDIHKENHVSELPVVLWNHRWEYDKNPELFFKTLIKFKKEGLEFKLIVLGESYKKSPPIFKEAQQQLQEEIIHFGFAEDFATYAKLLWQADILPVTNYQDFFGGSIVEAIYCNCFPLLPNRLAYPEHIPEHLQTFHLYNGEEDFYTKLKNALLNFQTLRKSDYQNFVSHYDWSNLAPLYDLMLQK